MWTCSEGQHHLPGCAASSKRSWKNPKFRVGMFTLGVKGWRDGAGSLRCNCAENATLPLRRGRRCSRDSSPIEVAARVAFDLIRIKPSGIILASKLDRGSEVEKPQRFAGLLLLFLDFFFFPLYLMNLAPCPKPEPKPETRNSPVSGLLERPGNIWHSCCREPRQEQSLAPVPIPKGAQSAGNGAALPKLGWQSLPGRDRRRGWAGSGAVPFSQGKKGRNEEKQWARLLELHGKSLLAPL